MKSPSLDLGEAIGSRVYVVAHEWKTTRGNIFLLY